MKVKAMNKSYFTLLIDTKKVLVALLEAKILPEARKIGVLRGESTPFSIYCRNALLSLFSNVL